MNSKKCIIVGAGEFDSDKISNRINVDKHDFCIAADGGLKYLKSIGILPDLIIGDMDSLEDRASLADEYNDITKKILPVEKDDTDMLAAIKEGLKRGCTLFELYGAVGGRLDHTIANIQCLKFLDNHNAKGIMYGDTYQVEIICNAKINYPKEQCKEGKKISVFSLGDDAHGVTEKGLKYELENAVICQDFPIGVSNEFTGQDCMIEVKDGTLLIYKEL